MRKENLEKVQKKNIETCGYLIAMFDRQMQFMASLQERYQKSSYFSDTFLKNVVTARDAQARLHNIVEEEARKLIPEVEYDEDE